MKIDVLTLFPKMFEGFLSESIIKRALTQNKVEINIHNIRDYTLDPHKKVDDYPFGGGAGPFMGNPFMSQNPFMNMPNFANESNDIPEDEEKFNIDDLVKKIDAKIAEIEKEEQSQNAVIDVKPEEESTPVTPAETKQPEKQSPTSEQNTQIQRMNEDNTSDDDFFDDFFSDD